jgi:hypothetical protein
MASKKNRKAASRKPQLETESERFDEWFAKKEAARHLIAAMDEAVAKVRAGLALTPARQSSLASGIDDPEKAARLLAFRKLVANKFDEMIADPGELRKSRGHQPSEK